MSGKGLRLYKREKLCSVTAIDRLFAARSEKGRTLTDSWGQITVALSYPLRMVCGDNPRRGGAPVQFLISVPKKRLRHAVDRVTMRRRIREAYRHARGPIESITDTARHDVAFIYVANTLLPYDRVARAMARLLEQIPSQPSLTSDPS